jgi:hypothetical protein
MVTPVISGLDKISPFVVGFVGLGLVLTFGCVVVSLVLLKGVKK